MGRVPEHESRTVMSLRSLFDRPPLPPPPEPEPEPAAEPEPCRCGCVALRVRNAHLEDKVARLVAVLGPAGGAIYDNDADRQAADRNWAAWLAGQDLGPGPAL
jgi:hypothetical protein